MSLRQRGTPALPQTAHFDADLIMSPSSFNSYKCKKRVDINKDQRRRKIKIFLATLAGLLVLLYLVQPDRASSNDGRDACDAIDPWSRHGWVNVHPNNAIGTAWTTIMPDPTCPSPRNYLAELANPTIDSDDKLFNRFRGKSIILLGDKLDKQGVEHFCTLLGQRSIEMRLNSTETVFSTASRICEYPRLDMRLVAVDLEEVDGLLPPSNHESVRQDRLKRRIGDVVQAVTAGGQRKPSLVVVSLGFADLVQYGKEDEAAKVELHTVINAERILRLERLTETAIMRLQRLLPDTPVALRSVPRVKDDQRTDGVARFAKDIRIQQLRGLHQSWADSLDLAFFDLARVASGLQSHSPDQDLALNPGGVLYAQGLLHHLQAEQSQTLRSRWLQGYVHESRRRALLRRLQAGARFIGRGGMRSQAALRAVAAALRAS